MIIDYNLIITHMYIENVNISDIDDEFNVLGIFPLLNNDYNYLESRKKY